MCDADSDTLKTNALEVEYTCITDEGEAINIEATKNLFSDLIVPITKTGDRRISCTFSKEGNGTETTEFNIEVSSNLEENGNVRRCSNSNETYKQYDDCTYSTICGTDAETIKNQSLDCGDIITIGQFAICGLCTIDAVPTKNWKGTMFKIDCGTENLLSWKFNENCGANLQFNTNQEFEMQIISTKSDLKFFTPSSDNSEVINVEATTKLFSDLIVPITKSGDRRISCTFSKEGNGTETTEFNIEVSSNLEGSENVRRCSNSNETYKQYDDCTYSTICGTDAETIKNQSHDCGDITKGCDNHQADICVTNSGAIKAVSTNSTEPWPCISKKTSVPCNGSLQTFRCDDGSIIDESLTCNFVDDCGSGHYEDELYRTSNRSIKCDHQYGVECENPPYIIPLSKVDCDNAVNHRVDCNYTSFCQIAISNCTSLSGSNISVYEGQMCDPTGAAYCSDLSSYMDCRVAGSLGCRVDGKWKRLHSTILCNRAGKAICDNRNDLECVIQNGILENIYVNNRELLYQYVRGEDAIRCPNSTFYIPLKDVCDGEDQCEVSEEAICSQSENSQLMKLDNGTFAEFSCLPDLFGPDSTCAKTIHYYEEDMTTLDTSFVIHSCTFNDLYYTCSSGQVFNQSMDDFLDNKISTIIISQQESNITGYMFCNMTSIPPIHYNKWCDTVPDCPDSSDETNCTEYPFQTFYCGSGTSYVYEEDPKSTWIPMDLMCDGEINCANANDECNVICPNDASRNIITPNFRIPAGVIGVVAFIINAVSLVNFVLGLRKARSFNSLVNESFVGLIALGDLMIGVYMILILAATLIKGKDYCSERLKWLSSYECEFLGILSTAGTFISLLSMTLLSVFRMVSLRSMLQIEISKRKVCILILMMLIILLSSIILAGIPLFEQFTDYFVNGIYYEDQPIFTDVARRKDFRKVIEHFNPYRYIDIEWRYLNYDFQSLFLDERGPTRHSVGFYGNQGVCLFKYFVTKEDPQFHYSLSVLGLSCLCFVIITASYSRILTHASSTSSSAGLTESQKKSTIRLQRKVTLIIMTDFLTWIPFLFLALLHFAGVIGVVAFIINAVSLVNFVLGLRKARSFNSLVNESFVGLIALGDLMIGVYMILILAATLIKGKDYCSERLKWLSSYECEFLGILSTAGTFISLLSMTLLSVFRMVSLRSMLQIEISKRKVCILILMMLIILLSSIILAGIPLFEQFTDYFVNGIYYEDQPIFTDVARRKDFRKVIEHFNPYRYIDIEWRYLNYDFQSLFLDERGPTRHSVGFYGNQGVCLFKYFVTKEDPQFHYSLSVLGLSCLCFVIITASYSRILTHASSTSSSAGLTESQKKSTIRLQRKVTLIIMTDFLTWIPFLFLALLHFGEVIDATNYYEVCSVVLMPINSVINPVIYNGDEFVRFVKSMCRSRSVKTPQVTVAMSMTTMANTSTSGTSVSVN
eukprot:sb/3460925/